MKLSSQMKAAGVNRNAISYQTQISLRCVNIFKNRFKQLIFSYKDRFVKVHILHTIFHITRLLVNSSTFLNTSLYQVHDKNRLKSYIV